MSDDDVGARVESLLAAIADQGGPAAAATAEELVRALVDYYGAGLERIAELVGPDGLRALAADAAVSGMLVVHGLHPLDVATRVEQALDQVRPYLGSHAGGVAFLGIDDNDVAHLRLDGSCQGCPSSDVTVRVTIEQALLAAAPELQGIEVEGAAADKPLLHIGMRAGLPSAGGSVWRHPAAPALPAAGTAVGVDLDGRSVLMARLADTYYAYADTCASCGASLSGASLAGPSTASPELDGDVLTCRSCRARYDLRLAGISADGTGRRLDPLPLLDDASGLRVAVPVPEAV